MPGALTSTTPHERGGAKNGFTGTCIETIYLGEVAQHQVKIHENYVLRVTEVNPSHLGKIGDTMNLCVSPEDVVPLTI